jgi:hypothetical protein
VQLDRLLADETGLLPDDLTLLLLWVVLVLNRGGAFVPLPEAVKADF